MITNLLSYNGRLDRGKYWGAMLIIAILITAWFAFWGALSDLTGSENEDVKALFGLIIIVGTIIFWSFPSVKRFHDLGMPGWYFWLLAIPFLNIYFKLLLFFKHGTLGSNKYGEDPMNYETRKQTTESCLVFLTPPRWESWRRYAALCIAILGLLICYQISYIQIRDSIARHSFSLFDLLLLWPVILVWIGWFNFIGKWGYVNRVVLENGKATFHVLGFIGKEAETITMETVKGFKSDSIEGIVNKNEVECFVKRKYLSRELRDNLMEIGKTKQA